MLGLGLSVLRRPVACGTSLKAHRLQATLSKGAQSKTKAAKPQPSDWWKHAVFYEIYPRSFADSNGDGIGDLNGITSKLDYLKELGVDAIWITPCFPSPQVDFGYDVSDYEDIDPMYGTLSDFDQMQKEAQQRWHSHHSRLRAEPHLRPEQVVHRFACPRAPPSIATGTSGETARGRTSLPITGLSLFGGSAWQFDGKTKQYYYHYFYPQQPDLNWRNPAVKDAMFDVTRWWYNRGVAGFRLDAVDTLFEDPNLHDNPDSAGQERLWRSRTWRTNTTINLPEVHDVLKGLRQVADKYDAVLVGETWTDNIEQLKQYYGDQR